MGEYLKNIFGYSQDALLFFNSPYFWIFFGIVFSGYCLIHDKKRLRSAYLFFISLFFYYKVGGFFFFILLFSTVTDYWIGKEIYKSVSTIHKKWWLALSLFVNLCVLIYFKYSVFFVTSFNDVFHTDFKVVNHFMQMANAFTGADFDLSKFAAPIGISFFTFQTISYSADIYRERIKPVNNILDFGFYVSFFPQLVMGPIVRASEFIPQLHRDYRLRKYEFALAIYWIIKGLTKKIILGDYVADHLIDHVFKEPMIYTGFENLTALYGYSLQVYADFSGYTDIAIGIALLMGFRLPTNFNSPYKARNVGDFWKRWHMSLSAWLKDYLYIPSGGNRGGTLFTYIAMTFIIAFIVLLTGNIWYLYLFIYVIAVFLLLSLLFPAIKRTISTNINLMITMLIGGLWHGASWNFVIWGGLNGLGLIVYKFWRKISPWEGKTGWLAHFWMVFLTFNFITMTRIFFRSANEPREEVMGEMAFQLKEFFSFNTTTGFISELSIIPEIIGAYWLPFSVMIIGYIIHWLPSSIKRQYRKWFIKAPAYMKIIVIVIAVFIMYQTLTGSRPFIYFDF